MANSDPLEPVARAVEAAFKRRHVQLTLGGEPTCVPDDPQGPEWSIAALGPTKLRYAYALTDALIAQALPNAVAIYSTGKSYPGETNPRWAIQLVWNRDGSALVPALEDVPDASVAADEKAVEKFAAHLLRRLKLKTGWLRAIDPAAPDRIVRVLPLDHDGRRFRSEEWELGPQIELLRTDGPAGLRLPLQLLAAKASRRALTVEVVEGKLHLFLPPLRQAGFLALFEQVTQALHAAQLGPVIYGGYVPSDEADEWSRLAIGADPGVLEINLPPCAKWREYRDWLVKLERAASSVGLRSFKRLASGDELGTGGGNHVLFGGPTLETNPLFTHPRWVTSILRYWQHHPSLAYLFTGQYVGASSQAPRPDESSSAHYDLEMAYRFLESLPPGDHRHLLSETLRHLHTDGTGNTHRSEISFDKFWNVNFDGGCRGLVEFRAIESLPSAEWMSAVALLWHALAAMLLEKPFNKELLEHGDALHDRFFLPAFIWADFERIRADLRRAGFPLPLEPFRSIAEWRCPVLLAHREGSVALTVRRGLEGWPLLSETPIEGGTTSRFVDTSMERLEFLASPELAKAWQIYVQGRRLELRPFPRGAFGAGLRYRRSALYPSLHPGIAPHLPLHVVLRRGRESHHYVLTGESRRFEPSRSAASPRASHPCRTLKPGLLTCDLRLAERERGQ
jgi:uncharacterized protein (DUF2126 family)